eukprot:5820142-Prymnesium_polylepis.2
MVLPDRFGCGSMPQRVCDRCRRQLPQISRQNYYNLLGVSQDITAEQLEFAFVQRARSMQGSSAAPFEGQAPPHSAVEDESEEWLALSVAYDVLSDPERRDDYDASLTRAASLTRQAPSALGGLAASRGTAAGHSARSCQVCQTPFNPIKRRHHCRACGRSVCGDCSPHARLLPALGHTQPVRHCVECERLGAAAAGAQTPPMASFSTAWVASSSVGSSLASSLAPSRAASRA